MIKKTLFLLLLVLSWFQAAWGQSPGNALNFDGTNDFVSLPYNALQNTSSFTFECWVRPTGGSSYRALVSSRSAGSNTMGYIIYINPSGKWDFWTGNNSTSGWNYLSNVAPVVFNKWTHIAATYDGTTMKFYVNGSLAGSSVASAAMNTTDPIKIGAGDVGNDSFFFPGSIDEVRFWNVARTEAQIKSGMSTVLTPAINPTLVAYYGFDQGTAGGTNTSMANLTDGSSNLLNGTLKNFALTGSGSNFVESYAMVAPVATAPTNGSGSGFTANWTAPAVGTAEKYFLDVATDNAFTNFITGYNGKDMGTSTFCDVATTSALCYYRVRADKASVTGQGAYSNVIAVDKTVTQISGSPGNTLNFDGTNDYVSIPYNSNLSPAAFTVEGWIRPSSVATGKYHAVFSSRGTSTISGTIIYINPNNKWDFWTGNGSGWNTIENIADVSFNTWTHLAATYDGTTMKFYINGVLKGSKVCTVVQNTTAPIKIGAGDAPGTDFFYAGSIDELRFWKTARTQDQINANMISLVDPATQNLVAYYSFDQGTPGGSNTTITTITDKTSNGLSGTLNGFALNSSTSNFIESYAMTTPIAKAPTNATSTGFTANWSAPLVGTADKYLLDVATDNGFTNFVPGFDGKDVGSATSCTVPSTVSCFYRVRAEKASVSGQGLNSNTIAVDGIVNFTTVPVQGQIFTTDKDNKAYVSIAGYVTLAGINAYEYKLYKDNVLVSDTTIAATYNGSVTYFTYTTAITGGNSKYKLEMYHKDASNTLLDYTVNNMVCTGPIAYSVPKIWWAEQYGAHRAILKIGQAADAARIRFLWRRHDTNPASRQLVVIDSITGQSVTNIYRNVVNNELCDIVAGPFTKAGTYYLYYLPYNPGITVGGSFNGSYKTQEAAPNGTWVTANNLVSITSQASLPEAVIAGIQARTEKDSFYPMELIPTAQEKTNFLAKNTDDYMVFPEDRANKIAMTDQLAYKWTLSSPDTTLSLKAARNEYYCYQLGIFANKKTINDVKLKFDDLKTSNGDVIAASKITCFNTDGVNPAGEKFTKTVNVAQNAVQAMWVGMDIAPDQAPGLYTGYAYVNTPSSASKKVRINLTVTNDFSADRGDSILLNYSRLRWLNSTLGLDSLNTADYTPIQKISDSQYSILGRTITNAPDGMPASVTAWGTEILNSQIRFIIQTNSGIEAFPPAVLKSSVLRDGIVVNKYSLENDNFDIQLTASIESDGYCHFTDSITAKKAVSIKDIRLEIPFKPNVGQYLMGFGQAGRAIPAVGDSIVKTWSTTFQSFWAGNPYGGVFCRLLGASYSGPLLSVYGQEPPATWKNGGLGGIKFKNTANGLVATAYSGARSMTANQKLAFKYALMITPVKPLDTKSQFTNKYYHALDDAPLTPSVAYQNLGVKVINFHHGNTVNPYINYPFITADSIRNQAKYWHSKGIKVKLYFTVRELTYFVSEIWALRSLGTEILAGGGGGGFPWLQEHLINNYNPQWYIHRDLTIPADAAVLTSTGDTRWYNYYVEAMKWMVKNLDIDGIYLDDVAYDRQILKRLRKAMESVKPGCMIDLHSNTGFSLGAATQYTEFFPYVDRLWFGESFDYNNMTPDYWLTEASGIPFGLISDEIYVNNNLQRGMVFASSSRSPSSSKNPDNVWSVWNSFGIQDAKMIGYWDTTQVVTTSNKNILATTYQKKGSSMIAVASWDPANTSVTLNVNLTKLDLSPDGLKVTIPTIANYQTSRTYSLGSTLPINAKSGYLILLEGTPITSGVSGPLSDNLFSVSPIPATTVANVTYQQNKRGHISMALFDTNGKKVRQVLDVNQDAGKYLLQLQVDDLTDGIYFLNQVNENGTGKTLRIIKQ